MGPGYFFFLSHMQEEDLGPEVPPVFPVFFFPIQSAQYLHFTFDIKKDFMKQDKITYDYMKHNCDKSQNYTY